MVELNTREKILKAGEELFSRKGYEATSVNDICEKAGVSKGAFFHYFPTKEHFFLEILDLWLKDLTPEIDAYIRESEDLITGILKLTEIFKEIFQKSREKFFLFMEFLRFGAKDERIMEKLKSYFEMYTAYFSNLIEEGIKKGYFQEFDPLTISKTMIAYAIGIIQQEIFNPELDWDRIGKEGIMIILNGIKRR